ncbi:MAG: hypothetical protein AXW12_12050 [Thalassospira sp. Nap_22]|uniref:hypothetical protein n=1 Tax=Thalassospira tepidiphila TaxID=393657 RepID=UPI000799E1F1|nr:MAG: hypothetical protein AXW12_12050 [Thalassospira sp. Nap_22]BDW89239.1 hypothetical protein MACH01_20060 [Thalassospira tepidiphila]
MEQPSLEFNSFRGASPEEGLFLEFDVIDPNLGFWSPDAPQPDRKQTTILVIVEPDAVLELSKDSLLPQLPDEATYQLFKEPLLRAIYNNHWNLETGTPLQTKIIITRNDIIG